MMTIVEMLEKNAKLFPQKTSIISEKSKISYELLYENINTLANFLIDIGIRKGDRVGLLLQKTPELVESFLGVVSAGGVVFPIDFNQTARHIRQLLELTDPFALIVDATFIPLLSQINFPFSDRQIIVVGHGEEGTHLTWEKVLSNRRPVRPHVNIRGEDVAYLNLTSGTTGIPKCAITTHDNIYWNTISVVECFKLTAEDTHLCMFPPFAHPHEIFARPIYLGGTLVLFDKISPKGIVKALNDNKVTCFMAIASIYEALVRYREGTDFNLKFLKLAESGGMHFSPVLAKNFKDLFKIPIIPVWGSTETAGIALAASLSGRQKKGSMGKPCPYYEIKIVNDDGEDVPANEIGEMAIKGPGVCSEYLGNPEETAKHMREGWFYSGDMVKKDSEGYFYFAGRRTGMMKVAGLKVFPTEIEDILSEHPKIAEVAVVKGQDGLHGEVPKAVLVPKEEMQIDKKEIRKYCEERLSRYKVPRIIEFRSHLPKTPGGKILWRKL
ncbi:MAG: class I adenylate-forming enzyme family protein [Desulfobacteraceae bacterium]|jgi:long-chain acyl-CoA synthetase